LGASRTLTSRERALYRASTGLILAVMLFSIINFVFNDHFPFPNGPEGAFVHLGFPPYFKVELTLAKIFGVLDTRPTVRQRQASVDLPRSGAVEVDHVTWLRKHSPK